MSIRRAIIFVLFGVLAALPLVRVLYDLQLVPVPDAAVVQRNRIPTLIEIAGDAETDAMIIARVVAYFDRRQEWLAGELMEQDGERLRALFAMYVVHISKPYGAVTSIPSSVSEWLAIPAAHCGTYPIPQSAILDAFGIEHRTILIGGDHALIEARIGARWEVFDATVNIWMSGSVDEIMRGEQVDRRVYYTPALDPSAPEIFRAYPSLLRLRTDAMFWGRVLLAWEVL